MITYQKVRPLIGGLSIAVIVAIFIIFITVPPPSRIGNAEPSSSPQVVWVLLGLWFVTSGVVKIIMIVKKRGYGWLNRLSLFLCLAHFILGTFYSSGKDPIQQLSGIYLFVYGLFGLFIVGWPLVDYVDLIFMPRSSASHENKTVGDTITP